MYTKSARNLWPLQRAIMAGAALLFVLVYARPHIVAQRSVPEGLASLLQAQIAKVIGHDNASYRINNTAAGYEATNAAYGYGVRFAHGGATVADKGDAFTIALEGYAYDHPAVRGNAVSYARAGMTEWFVNGPLGLEHGFTVSRRGSAPPALNIGFNGAARAVVNEQKNAVSVVLGSGRTFAYKGLFAIDAKGKQLPAWFDGRDGGVTIRVDDRGAAYPIVIDPYTQEQKFSSSDGAADDNVGYVIAMSGDGLRVVAGVIAAFIGADQPGAAYVFSRSGTTWSEEQKLTASDGVDGDQFGYAVSITSDGSRVIVGANYATIGANSAQGAAYVFSRSGTTWSQEQKLTASDGADSDSFGTGVAIAADGTRAIAGAPDAKIGANSAQGAAYVYSRSGTTWSQEQKLTASDGVASRRLGWSVTLDGTGARAAAGESNASTGAAYVYSRSGTTWSQEQKLTASDGAADNRFSHSLVFDSGASRILIGAFRALIGANSQQGAAYVFSRSGTTWSQEQKLTASDGAAFDQLSYNNLAFSADGAVAVLGSIATIGSNSSQGAVYVFTRSGTTWSQDSKLTASDGAANDDFGISVAVDSDGTRVAGGSPYATISGNANQGAVYVFLTGSGSSQSQSQSSSGGAGNSIFVSDIHNRFAREYAARAYIPKNLALRAEHCTPNVCDAILQFDAPKDAALERFILRHSQNRRRIAFAGERADESFTFRFAWPANAELPVELCYLNANNAEFCSTYRIWTPAAIDANEVKIEQLRLVGDQHLFTVYVPAFHNFSYIAAGRSQILTEIFDEDDDLMFRQSVNRPQELRLLLDPRRYTLRLTPVNAVGEAGEIVAIPLDVFLLPESEKQTYMFRTDALRMNILNALADILKRLMEQIAAMRR